MRSYSATLSTASPRTESRKIVTVLCGIALIASTVATSGCMSSGFGRGRSFSRTNPRIPSLAFWKKDRTSNVPPPPARHFDPIENAPPSRSLAASEGSTSRSNDNALSGALPSSGSTPTSGGMFNKAAGSLDAAANNVARQARAIDSDFSRTTRDAIAKASAQTNSIAKTAGDFKSPAASASGESLTKAQRDFNAAIASTTKDLSAAVEKAQASATAPATNADANPWKNNFKMPGSGLAKTTYDASGKLVSAANATVDAVSKAPAKTAEAFAAATDAVYDSKGRLIDKTKSIASAVTPSSKSFTPGKLTAPVNNAFSSAANQFKSAAQNTTQAATNAIASSNQAIRANIDSAKDAVSEFKPINNPIAKATTFPAAAPAAMPSTPSMSATSAPTRQTNGFYDRESFARASAQPMRPASTDSNQSNILRADQVPADSGSTFAQAGSSFAQASNISAGDDSKSSFAQPVSYVADVDIPEKVLSGSSNWAPGRVHQLK